MKYDVLKKEIASIINVDPKDIRISKFIQENIERYGKDILVKTIKKYSDTRECERIRNRNNFNSREHKVSTLLKHIIKNHICTVYNEYVETQREERIKNMTAREYVDKELTRISIEHKDVFINELKEFCTQKELNIDDIVKEFKNCAFDSYDEKIEQSWEGVFSVKITDKDSIRTNIKDVIGQVYYMKTNIGIPDF